MEEKKEAGIGVRTKIICRFCLRIVDNAIKITENMCSPDGSYDISFYIALNDILPEISANLPMSTLGCSDCMEKLKNAFFFRNLCIQTELDITDHAARRGISCASVKLSDVLLEKLSRRKGNTPKKLTDKAEKLEFNNEFKINNHSGLFNEEENCMEFETEENCYYDKDFPEVSEIRDIIENIPEVEDVEDVPDLLDLNNLGKYIPVSHFRANFKQDVTSKNNPKTSLFRVIPAQPYVLKKILLYPCKFCNRALRTTVELEQHMGTHFIVKGACSECAICETYVPNRLMNFHRNLHTDFLACSFCITKFDAINFIEHMKLHYPQNFITNSKRKLCCICYHYFPIAFFLMHLESHKLGVPVVASNNLKCQICTKVFAFSEFEEHMKLHRSYVQTKLP